MKNLPDDWHITSIRDVTVRTSQRDPRKHPDKRFCYVDVSSVDNTLYKVRDTKQIMGSEAPSRARKDIRANDVLFATVRPTLKRIALIPPELDGEIASTGYCILRANKERIEPGFLYSCLLTDWFVDAMKKLERGASYPAVMDSDILNGFIPLPSLPEQRKIAAVLSQVQRAIEQQERLIALTTELKKTLLHQLFTQGLRGEPQKETEIGLVPESWRVTRFDEFCILQRGFDIIKKDQVDGDIPVVSSGGVASYHNIAKVKGPGVVVGRKGTLGKVHYIEGDFWPHDTTLWVKDFKGHDPLFTSYFLKTLRFERFNSGASNPTLNRNTVHAELVAFPNEEEQRGIGLILKSVEDKAHVHERKRQALTDLFRTMLHQLMTAQIRVNEIELGNIVTNQEVV